MGFMLYTRTKTVEPYKDEVGRDVLQILENRIPQIVYSGQLEGKMPVGEQGMCGGKV